MTYTLDVRGDHTYIVDGDGRDIALAQPDTYTGHGWTLWRPTGNVWDPQPWQFESRHPTRADALAACGYREGDVR